MKHLSHLLEGLKPFWNKKIIIPTILILLFIGYQQIKGTINSIITAKMMSKPVKVELGEVKEDKIYSQTQSAGRVVAKYSVDVVARVQGFLQKTYFKEGSYVKKGQVLFLIEPNEYQNAVNQASASTRESQAQLINDEKNLRRAKELVKRDFVSKSYYDEALAKRDATKALLDANRASLAQARLNLSYTRVKSPVDGKIGQIFITEGNFVNAQVGTLAKVVSMDPIYVTFTMKSEDYLQLLKSSKKSNSSDLDITTQLITSDGKIYDEPGQLDFVGNQVDESSGTIMLRATFKNNKKLLVPGDFVTVKMIAKTPSQVLLIPQEAVQESADGKIIYVVDKDNKAKVKIIKTQGQYEGFWIITEGLEVGDSFIKSSLQQLKPGSRVEVVEKIENDK